MVALTAPEQRIVLWNVSWETYERILADHEQSSAPRFTYDKGVLEIVSPLPEHERSKWAVSRLAEMAAEAMRIEFDELGSTTFRREDFQRGFEPDSCFYLQNEASVRNKDRIDLLIDPPPDLVIEIDLTHDSLIKLPIYAQFRVPEVWRYHGVVLEILVLDGDRYVQRNESTVLPGVTAEALTRLVAEAKGSSRNAWLRRVRAWAGDLAGGEGDG